jgi:hypothetical protein
LGKKVLLPVEVVEEIYRRKRAFGSNRDALHLAISQLIDEAEREPDIEIIWNRKIYFGKVYIRDSNLERLRALGTKYRCSYGRVLLSYIIQKRRKEGILGYMGGIENGKR